MLKMMRHHAKYFYVLFFVVILSFIFWGVGTVDKGQKGEFVAEVGKYRITAEEYWRAYENAENFYRDLYKEKFDEEMRKKLRLKENVLNSLIDNRVLLTAAKENGITVSDEELDDAIKHEPAFMRDGVFDSMVYENRLRLLRLTPEAFENARREELTVEKMKRLIGLSAHVSNEELSKITGDEQTVNALRQAAVEDARNRAVIAYVNGLKRGIKIKIELDVTS